MTPENEIRVKFWLYTAPSMLVIVPVMLLVVLNPFWFRQNCIEWFHSWMDRWFDRRAQYMEPYSNKRNLFEYIKGTQSPKNNTAGRPKFL